jgi:uncharacterized membrane protein
VGREKRLSRPSHQSLNASHTQNGNLSHTEVRVTAGALPPPEDIEKYDAIYPGAAEAIFKAFTSQVEHRQSLESAVILGNVRAQRLGPILGTVLASLVIVGGFLVVILNKDATGYAAVLTAGGFLLGNSLYQRFRQEKERKEKLAAVEREVGR